MIRDSYKYHLKRGKEIIMSEKAEAADVGRDQVEGLLRQLGYFSTMRPADIPKEVRNKILELNQQINPTLTDEDVKRIAELLANAPVGKFIDSEEAAAEEDPEALRKSALKLDWENVCCYHKPDAHKAALHERVNQVIIQTGKDLIDVCPSSPDLTVALTTLQTVRMWANASIALHVESGDAIIS